LQALTAIDLKQMYSICMIGKTGIISPLLEAHYGEVPFYADTKSVFTIHNLKYQGISPKPSYMTYWN